MPKVIILTGGSSSEREISLKTATTIKNALNNLGQKYLVLDVAGDDWKSKLTGATVIIALHGMFGEDGKIQKILEKKSIPFTGSGSKQSEIAFNKKLSKEIVWKLGIVCPKNFTSKENLSFPVVIKPNKEGSSYGISIVEKRAELDQAINMAQRFDKEVLLEEYIKGVEFSCTVTEITGSARALPITEIIPSNRYFDYHSKYSINGAKEITPARISKELTNDMQQKSEKIFNKFNLRQYARIDWIVKDNHPYFLEVNTLPGMTSTSLINKELNAAGISIARFISFLIADAKY